MNRQGVARLVVTRRKLKRWIVAVGDCWTVGSHIVNDLPLCVQVCREVRVAVLGDSVPWESSREGETGVQCVCLAGVALLLLLVMLTLLSERFDGAIVMP